jgi:hypothetical protein
MLPDLCSSYIPEHPAQVKFLQVITEYTYGQLYIYTHTHKAIQLKPKVQHTGTLQCDHPTTCIIAQQYYATFVSFNSHKQNFSVCWTNANILVSLFFKLHKSEIV